MVRDVNLSSSKFALCILQFALCNPGAGDSHPRALCWSRAGRVRTEDPLQSANCKVQIAKLGATEPPSRRSQRGKLDLDHLRAWGDRMFDDQAKQLLDELILEYQVKADSPND